MRPRPVSVHKYRDRYRTEQKKDFQKKVLLVCAISFAGLALIVYGLFFARLFDVRAINVSGTNGDIGLDERLDQQYFGIKIRSNIFFLSTNKLVAHVLAMHPELESLKIEKQYAHTLAVRAVERRSLGIWCIDSKRQCFYFDQQGIAYASAPDTTGFLVLHINDLRDRTVTLGETIENDIWRNKILKARELFQQKNITINRFEIPKDSFDQFDAIMENGARIMMSTEGDIIRQINGLSTFLTQKLSSERRSSLSYVDLRIAGRIYYK